MPKRKFIRFLQAFRDGLTTRWLLAGDRPVIDDSYSIGLSIVLRDAKALERYLIDPIHQKFLNEFGAYWLRAKVYDYR